MPRSLLLQVVGESALMGDLISITKNPMMDHGSNIKIPLLVHVDLGSVQGLIGFS